MSKILIIEDDPVLRHLIHESLSCFAAVVESVTTAEEGLTCIEDQSWTLLITDIQTPGNLSGIELARIVVTNYPKIAVVVTSGRSDLWEVEPVLGASFLPKPWSIEDLHSLVLDKIQPHCNENFYNL